MELGSSAFRSHGGISVRHTCEGGDAAPPLQWQGVPEQAASLVLIVAELVGTYQKQRP